MHGGRRRKSLEGGNRGEFAPTLVSIYGEFAAVTRSELRVEDGRRLIDQQGGVLAAVDGIGAVIW